ncbi:MAG: tandem-95 repeat protein, partial [Sulfurospirillaceae bacterium]|nr:tandem-95 repeat protein [Sulfurospirillaceae bacterium]
DSSGDYTVTGDFNSLAAGETKEVTFQYVAIDNSVNQTNGESKTSEPKTVTLTITGTNDAPVAVVEENFGVYEDGVIVNGQLVANDIDSDDDASTLTYSLVGDAPVGFVLNANGSYVFDPSNEAYQSLSTGQTQDVSFTWIATDSHGATTNEQTVTITVTGTNDAPVLDLNGMETPYTESFENLLTTANTWTVITNPVGDGGMVWNTQGGLGYGLEVQNGNVGGSLASDGDVHAELDSYGLVTMSTTVVIPVGEDGATLTFDYKPRPGSETDSDMRVTLGDTTFTINGTGSIVGLDGATVVTNANGWMSVTANISGLSEGANTLSFEGLGVSNGLGAYLDNIALSVDAGNNHEATFTENGASVAIADVDAQITDVDDANIESATVTLTNAFDGDFLVAGTMPAGITAVVLGNTATLTGSATLADYQNAIKAISFGSESENPDTTDRVIKVTVNDGNDNSNTATTTVHVIAVNDAPIAVDDAYMGQNLIVNGSFEDVTVANTQGWGVNASAINGWNFSGSTYMEVVNDGYGGVDATGDRMLDMDASPANMTISQVVAGVEAGKSYQLTFDTAERASSDSVLEVYWNGALISTIVSDSQATTSNTLVVEGIAGENTLTFKEVGTLDNSGTFLDNVQLKAINAEFILSEDTPKVLNVLANDIDVDSTLSITGFDNVVGGAVVANADGTVTFTPTAEYSGFASFEYTISDGELTDTASVSLYVTPVNDAPVVDSKSFVMFSDSANLNLNLSASDIEGDTLSVTVTGLPTNGVVMLANETVVGDGATLSLAQFEGLRFDASGAGNSAFSYQVSDGNGGTADGTVNFSIGANVAPDGYTQYNGHFYRDFDNGNRNAATDRANNQDGNVVHIDDAQENAFVDGLVNGDVWLNATDSGGQNEGSWRDSDGNPLTYTNWAAGEPNNVITGWWLWKTDEDYAEMYNGGKWNDIKDSDSNHIVVEKDVANALNGTNGDDTMAYSNDATSINGGDGVDTLLFAKNSTVNFNNITDLTISNIEVLDLTQANVAITNLNPQDVLDITDDANTILKVLGDSGDSVSGSGWSVSADATGLDDGFDRYEATIGRDLIKIDIQDDIHTDFN